MGYSFQKIKSDVSKHHELFKDSFCDDQIKCLLNFKSNQINLNLSEKFKDNRIYIAWINTLRIGYFIASFTASAIDCIFMPKPEFCRYYNVFDLIKNFHSFTQKDMDFELTLNIYLLDSSLGEAASLKIPKIQQINFIYI